MMDDQAETDGRAPFVGNGRSLRMVSLSLNMLKAIWSADMSGNSTWTIRFFPSSSTLMDGQPGDGLPQRWTGFSGAEEGRFCLESMSDLSGEGAGAATVSTACPVPNSLQKKIVL